MVMARIYIADLPGGTATTPVQIQGAQKLKKALVTFLSAAVGKIEISVSPTSQIGTAQPTDDVLARVNCSATAGNVVAECDLTGSAKGSVKAFQTVYVHQTGAGNLGSVSLQ